MDAKVDITREGPIAVVGFDKDDGKNTLCAEAVAKLTEAALAVAADTAIGAVVLKGGTTKFSSGADLSLLASIPDDAGRELLHHVAGNGRRMAEAWEQIPVPTIAAIEGACAGGAAVLATACDFRLMATGAFMVLPEMKLGLPLGWGGLPRLVALVGPARAKRMVMFPDLRIAAETAEIWGLSDATVDRGAAVETALSWARGLANRPRRALIHTKAAANASTRALIAQMGFNDDAALADGLMDPGLRRLLAAFAAD